MIELTPPFTAAWVPSLAKGLFRYEPASILHSDQLSSIRRDFPETVNKSFWTGDLAVYMRQQNKVFLYLARVDKNILFSYLCKNPGMVDMTHIKFSSTQLEEVINDPHTLKTNLSALDIVHRSLSKLYAESGFLSFDAQQISTYSDEKRLIGERMYGSGDAFEKNIQFIQEQNSSDARIVVYLPEYVNQELKKTKHHAIVRAVKIGSAKFDKCNYYIAFKNIGHAEPSIAGIRKEDKKYKLRICSIDKYY